jgi:hypothetical protein
VETSFEIGSGEFGSVFRGVVRFGKPQAVAVKQLKKGE